MPDFLMVKLEPRKGSYYRVACRMIYLLGGCWEYDSVRENGMMTVWHPTYPIEMELHYRKGNLYFKVVEGPVKGEKPDED